MAHRAEVSIMCSRLSASIVVVVIYWSLIDLADRTPCLSARQQVADACLLMQFPVCAILINAV